MAINVRIPQPLQRLTNDHAEVEADGSTVKDLIDDLEHRYPGIKERICDESGKVRRFVNVYVNEEDIRFLNREDTKLKDGDDVSIIPAIAGGGSTHFVHSPYIQSNHPERMSKANESKEKFYIYIIRCKDGSLYTGLTVDVEKRFNEHICGEGSFYTKYNASIKLVYIEEFYNFLDAQKRERQIKGWTHRKKEALIAGDLQLLKKL